MHRNSSRCRNDSESSRHLQTSDGAKDPEETKSGISQGIPADLSTDDGTEIVHELHSIFSLCPPSDQVESDSK